MYILNVTWAIYDCTYYEMSKSYPHLCNLHCRGLDLRVIKHEAEYYGITPLGMIIILLEV